MSGPGLRADARACFDAAVAAVDPERLVRQRLSRDGGSLRLVAPGADLSHGGPVILVAAGKAALAMARGAAQAASPAAGVIVVPHGAVVPGPEGLDVLGGAHPVPDLAGLRATERVLAAIEAATPQTLVLVLLSGGASALLVAPAGNLTLTDKRVVTAAMLASGADISALNTVRKHCSRVKGGGLVRAAARAAGVWTSPV
jgi:hydroxypyruvate reductase